MALTVFMRTSVCANSRLRGESTSDIRVIVLDVRETGFEAVPPSCDEQRRLQAEKVFEHLEMVVEELVFPGADGGNGRPFDGFRIVVRPYL
ncbi:MAG: hypothetical protein ABUU24_04415, partial [Variovorax sp.]